MAHYRLQITTLAPLHIGAGEPPLRKGIDFVGFGQSIYVFDTTRVLDYVVGDDLALLERVTSTVNLASFLKEQDFREQPDLALYRLHGAPGVSEVTPQIKDVYDRPYLPGSSLKGALRTALIDEALLASGRPLDMRRLGDRDKYAAQELERDVAGRGERPSQAPNYDLFRALRVSDSQPGNRDWLELANVAVWPAGEKGIPVDVEALRAGVSFEASMSLDEYLFSAQASRLGFGPKRALFANLSATCRVAARERIDHELRFFSGRSAPRVLRFYEDLQRILAGCDEHSFLLQIGWGAGWRSKTVVRTLTASEHAIRLAVQRYRLDRGKGRGGEFPATRHLVQQQRVPVTPLGWVRVEVTEVA